MLGMKRHRYSSTASPDLLKSNVEIARMNLSLLSKLVPWLDANEKTQRKFWNAVLVRLSRIETLATMIHGAQIAEGHLRNHHNEEKIKEHTDGAEIYIAEKSNELGVNMVKYIYGKSEGVSKPHDRRRKWTGWEI